MCPESRLLYDAQPSFGTLAKKGMAAISLLYYLSFIFAMPSAYLLRTPNELILIIFSAI
jgi:hypothetical protein